MWPITFCCRQHLLRCFRKHSLHKLIKGPLLTIQSHRCLGDISKADPEKKQEPTTTVRRKPKTNEPFVKNLFLGKFDKSLLEFPEIDSNEELDALTQMAENTEKFMKEEVNSQKIDQEATIPPKIIQQLKDAGLFGQQIPEEYGGLGLNATGYARIAEATGLDGSIAVTLAGHQNTGLKAILLFGTEEQKQKYLPKLASGEVVAAFALTETGSGSDAGTIQTKATLSDDRKTYVLNGEKIWITNGGIADVFTVFAREYYIDEISREKSSYVTAFIVERSFGGVTNGQPNDKLGVRGSNTSSVFFENTPVPVENVLIMPGSGFKVAMHCLNSGRFAMGSACAGALKHVMGQIAEHAISRVQFGKSISEFGLIQEKIGQMAVSIYAMESMTYMTAGIVDAYEYADTAIESAIVKVFSSEATWTHMSEALQIVGGLGYMKTHPYERWLRDMRILPLFEGTNEILRLFISMSCVQHAGLGIEHMVKKIRDPLNNMGFILKKRIESWYTNSKEPSLRQRLYEDLHPNLKQSAMLLETNVYRLQHTVEFLLNVYGNDIIEEQLHLKDMANIAIDMYAMTACIARASRSICIGLRNADHEIMLATTFCYDADRRIRAANDTLRACRIYSNDESHIRIAETVFKHKGYAAEHPLTRNW